MKTIILFLFTVTALSACGKTNGTFKDHLERNFGLADYKVTCYSGGQVVFEDIASEKPYFIGNEISYTSKQTGKSVSLNLNCTTLEM